MQGYCQDDLSELVRSPPVVEGKSIGSKYSIASSAIISGKECSDTYAEYRSPDATRRSYDSDLSSKAIRSAMEECRLLTPQMGNRAIDRRQQPPETPEITIVDDHSTMNSPDLTSNSSITSTDSTREESERAAEILRQLSVERKQKDLLPKHQKIMIVNQRAIHHQNMRERQLASRSSQRAQVIRELRVQTDNLSVSSSAVQQQNDPTPSYVSSGPISTSDSSGSSAQSRERYVSEDSGIIADREISEEMMKDPYLALRTTSDSSVSQLNTPKNLCYNLSGVLGSGGLLSPIETEHQTSPDRGQQSETQQQKRPDLHERPKPDQHMVVEQHHLKLESPTTKSKSSPHYADDEISLLSSPSVHRNQQRLHSKSKPDNDGSVISSSSSVIRNRLVNNETLTGEQELVFYHYVSQRSILQLVTEDMMSEKWKLVDYALLRLCEICCSDDVIQQEETDNQQQQLLRKSSSANRIRFIKAGGHALIVGVMKKFAHVADIQASACHFIQNFLCRDKEGAFSELLGSVNGIERILSALQRFPSSFSSSNESSQQEDRVYRYACGALTALVCSSRKMVQRLMMKPGNLRLFLAAMKVNMETNKDAVGICRVLFFISSSAQYCNEITAAGGVEEIVREMRQYSHNEDVQLFGCGSLANVLASTNQAEVAQHLVDNLGGAQLVGAAMKKFPDSEIVQEKGVHAIYVMSGFKGIQHSIKVASGLSSLGMALERFPESKTIEEFGSAAMKRLLESGR